MNDKNGQNRRERSGPAGCAQRLFKNILEREAISAVLAPWRLPAKKMVMPTLLTDPDQLNGVDPIVPRISNQQRQNRIATHAQILGRNHRRRDAAM
jgi:hypothetical protein